MAVVEMAIPFSLGPDGQILMVNDPWKKAYQRVRGILETSPGERIMDGTFGVDVDSLLFEPDDEVVEGQLATMVDNALARYEPGIKVETINPIYTAEGDGVASIDVELSLTEDPTTGITEYVNTATVFPGGSVTEIIRG